MASRRRFPAEHRPAVQPRRARGRPRLTDVARIETRLLSVALREFMRHGYGGTSMARIIKAAGTSKTTLYSRYRTKAQLFRAIMQQQIDRSAGATLFEPHLHRHDLREGLKAFAGRMLANSLTGDLLQVNRLIYSESHRFPELGAAAAERTAIGIRQVRDFIRQCAARGGSRCRDPEGLASAFIYMLRGWYVDVMLTNRRVSAAQRARWVRRAVDALLAA